MNYKKIAQAVSVFTFLVGVMVMVGWFLNITVLTSILPHWIRMKMATAVCFVLTSVILFIIVQRSDTKNERRSILMVILLLAVIMIMGTLFLSSVFGFQTGMENIAFTDVHEISTPIFAGRPSVATMINFILIATIGFLCNLNRCTKKTYYSIGAIIASIGTVAVIGYVFNNSYLTYEIPGISNAIAVHTTILFVLIGTALILLGKES